jgi:hypothetical protein
MSPYNMSLLLLQSQPLLRLRCSQASPLIRLDLGVLYRLGFVRIA